MKAELDDKTAELPLDDERAPKKHNRHVAIALAHMNKRRLILISQEEKLAAEIDGLDEAIKALQGR
jgi:hypothetical protein